MSAFRSTAHSFATLLVLALAACADDSPTTPSAASEPIAASAAPATGQYRWAPLPFNATGSEGVGSASASGLPASGIFCFNHGNGFREYQLTIGPLWAALATAKEARVEWSMKERHLPNGGQTSVSMDAEATSTMGGPLGMLTAFPTPITSFREQVVNYATRSLTPGELSTLQTAGGTLYVRIETGATAVVRQGACGEEIANAHAAITVYDAPRLMVAYPM